jgi:hypothetical protein
MNGNLKQKWLVIGVIWGVVITLTGWNIHMIDHVQARRHELETLRMDMHFIQTNQAGIQEVRSQKARLTHLTKSFSLGFVVVENNLKRLSWDFGLKQLQVEAEANTLGSQSVPMTIVASGTVPAIVGWIAAVEQAYPYLSIEQMDIAYDHRKRVCQLRAIFNYHYRISDMERMG